MARPANAEITDWLNEASISDLGAVGRRLGSGAESRTVSEISTKFDIVSRPLQRMVAFRVHLCPRGDRATVSSQLELEPYEGASRYLPRLCRSLPDKADDEEISKGDRRTTDGL